MGQNARRLRVAVVEEHDILRYGLVACLAEDRRLDVIAADSASAFSDEDVDVAIVSSELARDHRFSCPIVVCCDSALGPRTVAGGNEVAGALHRASLTTAQLHATVHAAAAGLHVEDTRPAAGLPLDSGALRLIAFIADGHGTREIAERMNYSERTIKKRITELGRILGARSRAQIVAEAMRQGLI
jgi:DNA-binding CsgD family transcriptional regulator